jgi:NADPH-dependent 2,4-dienoyl-CoA reductase/sulfur reductase-like enzyme
MESEFVIIGGGPAGIAAAVEAAKAGVKVTLIDENEKPGGQIYRQFENGFKATDPDALGGDYQKGMALLSQFSSMKERIRYLNNATVWGIFKDNTLAMARHGKSSSISFNKLLIATGAYDRPVPFPGWTLPGVLTAGGAQKLVKTERVLPGNKILLAGTGPLQLVLADQILKAGGDIAVILEAGNAGSQYWLKGAKGIWGNWDYLRDGMKYLWNTQKAGVPLLRRRMIVEAHGEGRVEEAVYATVDSNWRPVPGTERTVSVDTVCVGYGFVSSTELTQLLGCEHRYDLSLGGHTPVRSENMETTVPGVYAIGDCSGVAGSKVALEEGCVAGVSVAGSLDYLSAGEVEKKNEIFKKRLKKFNKLRKVLDEISLPRAGLFELPKDDTVICRCEEVTMGEVNSAMSGGATSPKDIKRVTRAGMGPCEGRMCGPFLAEIMSHQPNAPEAPGCLLPRPPIKPIALGVLAASEPGE